MPIRRSPEQKSKTLDQFYAEVEAWDDKGSSEGGARMRHLIARLEQSFPHTEIWGLTSHVHLLLQSHADYGSPWFVSIVAYGTQTIIEYLLPPEQAPWKGAVVRGVVDDLDTAIKYIKIAMSRSGGWPQSPELENAEPGASPNGGPAERPGNSGVGGGPPSVS